MPNPLLTVICLTVFTIKNLHAQEEPSDLQRFPAFIIQFNDQVKNKAAKLEARLTRQAEKYLQRLARREARLHRQLARTDSTAAARLFQDASTQYAAMSEQLAAPVAIDRRGPRGPYLPYLDSLKTSLSFLQQNSGLPGSAEANRLSGSLQQVQQLQGRLQQADQIKVFISQRKEQIKAALSRYTDLPGSISKTYKDFNKELFYYAQQVQEYRNLLNDPDKLLQKTLSLLNQLPAFQQFLQQHSELAGLFRLPAGYASNQSLAGLQTRDQVQQLMQAQLAPAGPNAQQLLQQNLQAAQSQLDQLKDKLHQLGGGSADLDMPDFKPNSQKTKSFWKRLEYGTNLQSQKSGNFFPTTSDIGLSVGYKLSDKSIIGLGGSYKVGWGKDIRHIAISSEGAGLRSFLDVKLKGSFFASGGFEYNYQPLRYTEMLTPAEHQQAEAWQQSGLVGISKIISLKHKTFKKTRVQLLWDFLSYQQTPKTQAVKFRVGYNF